MHPSKPLCAVAYYDNGSGLYHEVIGIYSISADNALTCHNILYGGGRSVTGLAFNKDGSLLASISDREGANNLSPEENTVKIWDTDNWNCIKIFTGHINDGLRVSFNADGTFLASSAFEEAKIWHIPTGACIKTFNDTIGYRIDTGSNYGLSNRFIATFHPTIPHLLAIGDNSTVKLIDIESNDLIKEFKDSVSFDYLPSAIEFDDKGEKIAVRYEDREFYRNSYLSWYEIKSGKRLGHIKINDNSGYWGTIMFDKTSTNIISGFCIAEKFYEQYIERPIATTIFEKLGFSLLHFDDKMFGRIGKFPVI